MSEWQLAEFPLERHLQRLFAHYGIETVLDVGANRGQYRDFLRHRVGFLGMIHSFEPIPELVAEMRGRQAGDPNWDIHRVALGREEGAATLNIAKHAVFSSLRQLSDLAKREFSTGSEVKETVTVPVRTLDALLPALREVAGHRVYLKLDTQGFDQEVMAGAPSLLRIVPAVQFEMAIRHLYEGVPDYRTMLATMEAAEFELSGLFPVTVDSAVRAVEFDCVMVRSALARP